MTGIIKTGPLAAKPEWGARGHQAGGFFRPRIMREFCLIPKARLSSGSSRTSHSRPWRPGRDRSVADAHGPHPRREDMPPKADMTTTWRQVALCHVWTAPSWQGFSARSQAGRCSHVFGLLARHTRPLAIMPSADQVPVKTPHSTMHWHKWVVLIAGSAGSALRAVRPPNLHITPDVGAILVTPQVRRVPCSDHPWPSWPMPFLRSCWRARSQRPW